MTFIITFPPESDLNNLFASDSTDGVIIDCNKAIPIMLEALFF